MLRRNIKFEDLIFYTYYTVGRAKITSSIFYNNQDYPIAD
jgi:hypothetical protein